MGLIDARSVFLRARRNQDAAEAAREKQAKKKATAPDTPTSRKERKRATRAAAARGGLEVPEDQEVCLRAGCRGTGPFRYGLCSSCYDRCVIRMDTVQFDEAPEDEAHPDDRPGNNGVGEREVVPVEDRLVAGEFVLVTEGYPNRKYRGLYAIVVAVEDDGAVALVELTGESDDLEGSRLLGDLRGFQLRLPAVWLLRVEE